ncbi:MAG: hypothetical protein H6937_03345 [Burkholderiales bacterium]|nr:hypothetical protein [Burkholderiales bacterium]MDR4518560.1 hypothetical protein [Nitrosomonas sp.]
MTIPCSKRKDRQLRGAPLNNRRTRETVTVVSVKTCSDCGEDLSKTACAGLERRTRIDIVFEKIVEHVDAEIKQCPRVFWENKTVSTANYDIAYIKSILGNFFESESAFNH